MLLPGFLRRDLRTGGDIVPLDLGTKIDLHNMLPGR